MQQLLQIVLDSRLPALPATQLAAERWQDRRQTLRVHQPIEVRKRALTNLLHRQVLLSLYGLTEIFNGPQRADGRIEKRQQVRDEHIVQKQPPIAVRRCAT